MDDEIKKVFDVLATELCRRVGCPYPQPGKQIQPTDYEWTAEDEEDFRVWVMKYLKKVPYFKRMGKRYIERELEWFIFNYSWKLKIEGVHEKAMLRG
jgi:hypothetical protein